MDTPERLYNVVIVNDKTGGRTIMTAEAVRNLARITKYPWRREIVEEVPNVPTCP